jgi:hypothetical protein
MRLYSRSSAEPQSAALMPVANTRKINAGSNKPKLIRLLPVIFIPYHPGPLSNHYNTASWGQAATLAT